jgi:hypothetical protein
MAINIKLLYFSIICQIISALITIILTVFFYNSIFLIFGAIVCLIFLFIFDALPYFSWYKKKFTYKDKYHHSTYVLITLPVIFIYYFYFNQFRYITIFNFNIDVLSFIIGGCFFAFITQIHELIYFKRLKFPDRGYPIHKKILFAKPSKDK